MWRIWGNKKGSGTLSLCSSYLSAPRLPHQVSPVAARGPFESYSVGTVTVKWTSQMLPPKTRNTSSPQSLPLASATRLAQCVYLCYSLTALEASPHLRFWLTVPLTRLSALFLCPVSLLHHLTTGGSQPPVTPFPRNAMTSSGLGHQAHRGTQAKHEIKDAGHDGTRL